MGESSMDKVFTCSEITQITDTFKTCIGEGAYGQVFLGIMSDGTRVAVKVLSTQDSPKCFSEEAKLLRIHHPNLVTLIGYCDDDVKKALIYEYVPNGDLGRHLSENSKRILLWDERLKIARDIAEGINFLHGQKPPIVHGDLKPANILLTEDMQAKIAGFIPSRAFPAEFATHASTPRADTFGYLDPHVFELGNSMLGSAKKENDVYSFGVILLVLLTGKPAIIGEGNDAIHITQWIESVTKSFTKKKKSSVVDSESIQSIIDPRLQCQFDIYAANKAIKLAMSCVKPITKGRPNMSHALEKLKAISNPKEKTGFFTNIITWVRSCFPFANSQSQNISYQMDKEGIPLIKVASVGPVSCKVERSSPVRPSPMLNGVDPMGSSVEKPRTLDDATDKTKPWQLAEIVDPIQCRLVSLPESTDASSKVVRLLYTNSGVGILALGSNGVQKLWKWTRKEQNPTGKATASVVPQHWQPNSGLLMINDGIGVNHEEAVPCIALSKNDCYVISAAGGKVSLFNMMTFKVMTTFMAPPPASTFLAFHPQDNNILAIGMEDSTIHIYNVRVDEVKSKLKGHQKRITGLAFSTSLNILVSSGADAQLCVWSIDTWEKLESVTIQIPAGKAPTGDTRVQFHTDQIHMLVVHETQLAIYDASKIERIRQWIPQDGLSAPISYAAYSCNSLLVYASFCDGNIGVFDADTLRPRCRVAPSAYLPQSILRGSQAVYPLVVAACPSVPTQFAIGLTDGSVKVMEPTESEGKWGPSPPVDNGILSGRTTAS